jgi:hypothetical protein
MDQRKGRDVSGPDNEDGIGLTDMALDIGLAISRDATWYGQPLESMTNYELLAVVGLMQQRCEALRNQYRSTISLLTTSERTRH